MHATAASAGGARRVRHLALGAWVLTMVIAGVVSISLGGWSLATGGMASVVVAAVLLLRRPGNRVGLALLGFGSAALLSDLTQSFLGSAPVSQAWWYRLLVALGASVFVFVGTMGTTLLLLYPTGDAPGRWRWVVRALLGIGVVGAVGGVIWSLGKPVDEVVPLLVSDVDTANPAELASAAVFVGFFPLALLSLLLRYKAAGRVVRLQIRWLLFAASLLVLSTFVQNALNDFDSVLGVMVNALAFVAFPVAIGVAVTRYRLYDVDRVVSRTIGYAVVIGLLVGVYLAVVALLTSVLPLQSNLAVASATLASVALVTPVRRRVLTWVDRRFNRTRYQADRELEAFTARIRDTTDVEAVRADLVAVIDRTLQPSAVGVWIRSRG